VNSHTNIPALAAPSSVQKTLIVEGWRFLPHSYAIVNQWQLLALFRKRIVLKLIDAPFYRSWWQIQEKIFRPDAEKALRAVEVARPGETADVLLRIFAPFTFSPSRSCVTAVFATLEQQVIRKHQLSDYREYEQLRRAQPPADVRVITPSRWSAEGFYKAGFRRDQVLVIPHGVDPAIFRPMPEIRSRVRHESGIDDKDFVFLNVGVMSGNKGIDLLLRGFAQVRRRFPRLRLILKGMDDLYDSKGLLQKCLKTLSTSDQRRAVDGITYFGNTLSHDGMAALYQAADAYVSPYRAEGFNLPVLEAASCGIPIICTSGGPTDDFVTESFARKIESEVVQDLIDGQRASRLAPNLDDLIAHMIFAVEDISWRRRAAAAGPLHVHARYTWDGVVDRLVEELLI